MFAVCVLTRPGTSFFPDTGEHSAGEHSASPPFSFPLILFFPFLLLNSGQKKYLTVLLDLEKDVDVNQWSQID